MHRDYVLTLTGPDRIGIVEKVTRLLLERGGNVETSRMARLGGEFAMLMLVSIPVEKVDGLEGSLEGLAAQGYKVTTTQVEPTHSEAHPDWLPFRVEVRGADHEGIINEVAAYLSQNGINIESADSETIPAPTTGTPLFTMTAEVAVPPSLAGKDWVDRLENLGSQKGLEIRVVAAE